MIVPSKEQIEKVRHEYPEGIRVELIKMDDIQSPPAGTKGTVKGVDDIGSIMVSWDNGSSLSVVYGEDICKRVTSIPIDVIQQILAIRDSGVTNMFDTNAVQYYANERGFYELVNYLIDHKKEYAHFIMTGE